MWFKCRTCGNKPLWLVEDPFGRQFHLRANDPQNQDPHTDLAMLGYIDGMIQSF
jgi:hypothetical protein